MTRSLRIMSFSLFLWGLGEGMFFYLQPLYLQELGANPLEIGTYLGAAGVVLALCHIPAGIISDSIGSKQTMVAAWFCGMVAGWIMFLANSLGVFVLGMLLYGVSGFAIVPIATYVSNTRGKWSMARTLTTTNAIYGIGAIIGPFLGGQLAEQYGFRIIYGAAALVFTTSALMILRIRRQAKPTAQDGPRYRRVLSNTNLRTFLPLVFIGMFAMYLSWPLTPNFLQEEKLLSVGIIGSLGSFNALGIVLLNLTLGRIHPRTGFLLAQAITAGSVLILWQSESVHMFALAYFMAGGFRTSRSLVTAQVDELVSRADIGLAYGLAETVSASVLILAPIIAGVLYSSRPWSPYPLSIALIAFAVLLLLSFRPKIQPRMNMQQGSKEEKHEPMDDLGNSLH